MWCGTAAGAGASDIERVGISCHLQPTSLVTRVLKEKYCSIGMPSTFNDHDYPARSYLIGDSVPSPTEDQFPATEDQALLVMHYPVVHSANHNDIERVWAFFSDGAERECRK